jgi:hypothetical protein
VYLLQGPNTFERAGRIGPGVKANRINDADCIQRDFPYLDPVSTMENRNENISIRSSTGCVSLSDVAN